MAALIDLETSGPFETGLVMGQHAGMPEPEEDRSPPEVEDRRALGWLIGGATPAPSATSPLAREDVHDFRPTLRPPVPVVTVLDDGSHQHGDRVRLRGESLVIGRTSGEVRIPNDPAISGQHAAIRRVPWKGGYQWQLSDLGSINGTFVRCRRAVLHPEAIVVLGRRRFRLRYPLLPRQMGDPSATRHVERSGVRHEGYPTLVEAAPNPGGVEMSLRVDELTIGRLGGGSDLELDDPLLAYRHAHLGRQRDGTWVITAETTRNGVWISVSTVALTGDCSFRCGEQVFRFELP